MLIVLAGRRSGKTLWDGLELLIVPLALAAVGFAFAAAQSARENRRDDRRAETDRVLADRRAAADRALAEDRQREQTLRTYLQQMSDLLLQHRLASSRFDAQQRTTRVAPRVLASTLTLTVLQRLDGERKGVVLRFIDDAQLISTDDPKLALIGADFRGAIVDGAALESPYLARVDLRGASFRSALLLSANFDYADLRGADFSSTIQEEPSFGSACLSGPTFVSSTLIKPSFLHAIGHDINFRHANITELNAARADARFWNFRGSAPGVPAETTDRLFGGEDVHLPGQTRFRRLRPQRSTSDATTSVAVAARVGIEPLSLPPGKKSPGLRRSNAASRELRYRLRGVASVAGGPHNPAMTEDVVLKEELRSAMEARKELGSEMEPAVIDAFVARIERRLADRADEGERALKRRRDYQKEMVLGSMGISIPLLAIAAIFTGLAGVIAVCVALVVIAVVSTRS